MLCLGPQTFVPYVDFICLYATAEQSCQLLVMQQAAIQLWGPDGERAEDEKPVRAEA